jgi:multiple sugar transport system substrate-binding protein
MPRDWDALVALIEAVSRRARPGALGGFIQHASSSWNYLAMVESLGGGMMNADESEIAFDDARGRHALAIHAAFGRAGQARMDMDREQARQAFAAGTIALMIDSSSSLAMLEKQIADRFALGTARMPMVANAHLPASGIAAVMMTRDPTRQAAAWQFIRYVCGPAGQRLIGTSTGYLPANDFVVSRSDLLGRYYQARPRVRPVVESLPFATRWYAFPGDNAAKIDSIIANGVGAVITLSKSPDQALASMRRSVEALLPAVRT